MTRTPCNAGQDRNELTGYFGQELRLNLGLGFRFQIWFYRTFLDPVGLLNLHPSNAPKRSKYQGVETPQEQIFHHFGGSLTGRGGQTPATSETWILGVTLNPKLWEGLSLRVPMCLGNYYLPLGPTSPYMYIHIRNTSRPMYSLFRCMDLGSIQRCCFESNQAPYLGPIKQLGQPIVCCANPYLAHPRKTWGRSIPDRFRQVGEWHLHEVLEFNPEYPKPSTLNLNPFATRRQFRSHPSEA